MLTAVGMAKTPPVPINRGFSDGICPYLLVSVLDLKFLPEAETSSMFVILGCSSPLFKGKLFTIAS